MKNLFLVKLDIEGFRDEEICARIHNFLYEKFGITPIVSAVFGASATESRDYPLSLVEVVTYGSYPYDLQDVIDQLASFLKAIVVHTVASGYYPIKESPKKMPS